MILEGGKKVRAGLVEEEDSSNVVKTLRCGAIIETCEEQIGSDSSLYVRLKDGSGWTTVCTGDDPPGRYMEELDPVSAAAELLLPEYRLLDATFAANIDEVRDLLAQYPNIVATQVLVHLKYT